jgi:transcription initiation factor TFIIIB Brf1 subunit/transcription initiation factor TFIIB
MPKTNHPELTKQVTDLQFKLESLKRSAEHGGLPDIHMEDILVWYVESIEEERERCEDKILDEKMTAIDDMISAYIDDRLNLPYKPAKVVEDPINWEPLVRQVRDFARNNTEHGRKLGRVIDAADKALAAVKRHQGKELNE